MALPLIALRSVVVTHGGTPLFTDLSLALEPGERACLIGRNGAGKSTVLRLLSGAHAPDGGERFVQPGVRIGYVPQAPVRPPGAAALDHVAEGLPESDRAPHLAEAALEGFGVAPDAPLETLSGGDFRRVALARALVGEPDLLLLDEPTNHLDLPTILALEDRLASYRGGLLVISHDRAFLGRLCRRIHWLDRGRVRSADITIDRLDAWTEKVAVEEAKEEARLDVRIAQELRYSQRGVTARRRRNERRVKLLADLRAQKAAWARAQGAARLETGESAASGKLVLEAKGIGKRFDGADRPVLHDVSLRVLRGERIGLIGPNGAGKTTLIRLLTGDLPPDSGTIRFGARLEVGQVDQRRADLNPEDTLWETLCPGGGDRLDVNGVSRHVVGYLRDYLFDEAQARAKVATLSGGERNRLLLAKMFARAPNLLVLDEPTNDLDLETLDLLADVLESYDGTLLLVSHDRAFIDQVCTSVIALEGCGRAREYVGGYSDYLGQRGAAETSAKLVKQASPAKPRKAATKLSYMNQRELDGLPARLEALGETITKLEAKLADPDLFAKDPAGFEPVAAELTSARQALKQAEERWLVLEELQETLRQGGAA